MLYIFIHKYLIYIVQQPYTWNYDKYLKVGELSEHTNECIEEVSKVDVGWWMRASKVKLDVRKDTGTAFLIEGKNTLLSRNIKEFGVFFERRTGHARE